MIKVLDTTDASPSLPWTGDANHPFGTVFMAVHNGGTWIIQMQDPEDDTVWVDTAEEFTEAGVKVGKHFEAGVAFRLNGGTTGARAYVSDFL